MTVTDVVSAIDEAQQIYFRNNNLLERLSAAKQALSLLLVNWALGQVVFGFLMEYLRKSHLKDIY